MGFAERQLLLSQQILRAWSSEDVKVQALDMKSIQGLEPQMMLRVYCTFPSIFRNDIHSQGTKSPVAQDCEVHFCFKMFVNLVKISHSRFLILIFSLKIRVK